MSAHLTETYSAEVTLTKSRGGAFEVTVDGHRVYSKLETGRFPTNEEIDVLIAAQREVE